MQVLEVEIGRRLTVDPNAPALVTFEATEIPVRTRIQAAVQIAVEWRGLAAMVRRREQRSKAPLCQPLDASAIGSDKPKLTGGEKAIDPRQITPVAIARRSVQIVDGRVAHAICRYHRKLSEGEERSIAHRPGGQCRPGSHRCGRRRPSAGGRRYGGAPADKIGTMQGDEAGHLKGVDGGRRLAEDRRPVRTAARVGQARQ